jgi:hypothetical protein
MALYIDDILLVGPSMPEIDRVKSSLANEFGIKDLGATEFILDPGDPDRPRCQWGLLAWAARLPQSHP